MSSRGRDEVWSGQADILFEVDGCPWSWGEVAEVLYLYKTYIRRSGGISEF